MLRLIFSLMMRAIWAIRDIERGTIGAPLLRIGAGPCAIEPCEPRQVRKEATVSNQFCVPQDHLAPLIFPQWVAVRTKDLLLDATLPLTDTPPRSLLTGKG